MCVCERYSPLSPGFDVVEQVLPALADALDLVIDLALLGLVGGGDELLSQLLQVSLVLTEQVDLLHAVLRRQVKGKDTNSASFNSKDLDFVLYDKNLVHHRKVSKKQTDPEIPETFDKHLLTIENTSTCHSNK